MLWKTWQFWHVTYLSSNLRVVSSDPLAEDAETAGSRPQQTNHHLDRGGLSCSIRAEKPVDLLGGNSEVQPVYREPITIILREIMSLDRAIFRQRSTRFMSRSRTNRAI